LLLGLFFFLSVWYKLLLVRFRFNLESFFFTIFIFLEKTFFVSLLLFNV
jgi:hypothetical protein